MIKHLGAANIGPVENLSVDFGQRLNLITGDTGLGKSFVLDLAWFAMTGMWPQQINKKLCYGRTIRPPAGIDAEIGFSFYEHSEHRVHKNFFSRKEQGWRFNGSRPTNCGIILYSMADGSFAVWDPNINGYRWSNCLNIQTHPPCVLSQTEVFDGSLLCEGLIRDWSGWQKEGGKEFKWFKNVLSILSDRDSKERMEPGDLTRISLSDVRDVPTIKTLYRQDLPVVHASFGIRRLLSLSYLLVWAWERYLFARNYVGVTENITFIIDGIDDHIDTKWQREILTSMMSVMNGINSDVNPQVIASSHSPLTTYSMVPNFDSQKDSWHELKVDSDKVVLVKEKLC